MAGERLPHIFLTEAAESSNYTSPTGGRGGLRIPTRNRDQHSQRLIRKFDNAWDQIQKNRRKRTALALPTRNGFYYEFKSKVGHDLITKSLDDMKSKDGARLLNVRTKGTIGNEEIIATVYIPKGKERHFLNKVKKYATEIDQRSNKPKNYNLINSIEDIRLAVLESFWQDPSEYLPGTTAKWCEVWLRTGISSEQTQQTIDVFKSLCGALNIQYQDDFLVFPERAVILIQANNEALKNLIESSDNIAEFRIAKQTARFWIELTPSEQADWVEDLKGRLKVNVNVNVAVTILDTGVNHGHELLDQVLNDDDCHSHDTSWGTDDHDGHGTNMAGLATYGDLQKQLEHSGPIEVNHKLESVKILPPQNGNDIITWGIITQQAMSRVEIQNPTITHIGCMAITSELETDRGRPSSWSGAIDIMTSGYIDDLQRLFIVSAGNMMAEKDYRAYPTSNQTKSVENPAQSWNALTVGAYTEKTKITDPSCQEHQVLAPAGGLSPYSITSLVWDHKKWPYKPDIVMEGGNRSKTPDGFTGNHEDLSILTTHHRTTERQFEIINGTSPATAQAAWMAAQIHADYPNAWPETVRGLMVHSAHWTDTMIQQFSIDIDRKTDVANLLRICGYGVPDFDRAISCANNSLTLIAQEYIQPFDKKPSGGYCTKDMHVHTLPWPRDVLLGLGHISIELRITLSYFVEPSPSEIGWRDRYRYASHALRFDLNTVSENEDGFLSRLNKAARDEEYESDDTPESGSDRWLIGKQNRKLGSINSDIWNGTAADIATCSLIGVYPVIGWWRERHHLGRWNKRARYSLIVSLNTPEQNVDLYTPVAVQLKIPIMT
ncbi:S8 family peptidase [Planctomycetota bacterium]